MNQAKDEVHTDESKPTWSHMEWDSRREAFEAGYWELDPKTSLRMIYGLDPGGRLSFGYISREKPSVPPLSSVVKIERRQRSIDGKWTLLVTLVAEDTEAVFRQLAEHIYARVSKASTESSAVVAFMDAVNDWKRLFSPSKRLSMGQLRGLFAELYVGFVSCADRIPAETVAASWEGPYMADQDFVFPEFSIEVKSCRPTSRAVDIASEHQLDAENIHLAVATIIDDTRPFENCMTLIDLIEMVRIRIKGNPAAVEHFEDAFTELSIDL